MGFSRQEYWTGLPFPSPMHESKKWKWNHSVVSNSLQPHGLYSPWNSPDQNTGVGSCSLLQGIFPAQGSNPGLPHCRQILYQLSHKGSPKESGNVTKWENRSLVLSQKITYKIYEFYTKHIYWALDNHWIVLGVVKSQRTRNSSMLVKSHSHI